MSHCQLSESLLHRWIAMSELSAELRCNLWLQGFGEEELREEELVEIQAFQQPGGRRERNWSWDGPGMGRDGQVGVTG